MKSVFHHAIRVAHDKQIHTEFIDLPWVELSRLTVLADAFSDGAERGASYISTLLGRLGLDLPGLAERPRHNTRGDLVGEIATAGSGSV